SEQLPFYSHRLWIARCEEYPAKYRLLATNAFRHQHFHVLSDEFLIGMAEESLDLLVHENNFAALSHHQHACVRCIDRLAKTTFGTRSAISLYDQCRDQQPLDDTHGNYTRNAPLVKLPQAWRFVADNAARREACLADAPTLELTSVEDVLIFNPVLNADIVGP